MTLYYVTGKYQGAARTYWGDVVIGLDDKEVEARSPKAAAHAVLHDLPTRGGIIIRTEREGGAERTSVRFYGWKDGQVIPSTAIDFYRNSELSL